MAQYNTNTCWSFSTTSYYESEIFRLSGKKIKLSEIWTVYFEYLEKVRRFVRERGDSLVAEGGEGNALNRIWKTYGIVPAEAYPGCNPAAKNWTTNPLIDEISAVTWTSSKATTSGTKGTFLNHVTVILNKPWARRRKRSSTTAGR